MGAECCIWTPVPCSGCNNGLLPINRMVYGCKRETVQGLKLETSDVLAELLVQTLKVPCLESLDVLHLERMTGPRSNWKCCVMQKGGIGKGQVK